MSKYAIFFPQFHRTAVNDSAWGAGFTDWALVAAANAFQWWDKRAPASGFYDLDAERDISRQFAAASDSGLGGFAIYHYWFEDGPELASVERWLRGATLPPGFGFFLVWANESWSKRWAGKEQETIKRLNVRPVREDIRRHVAHLAPLLSHAACRKYLGRPMFVFYRPEFFADPAETVEIYRKEFADSDLDVSLGFFAKSRNDQPYAPLFDFCYLFEPRLYFNTKGIGRFGPLHRAYRSLLRFLPYEKVEAISASISRSLGTRSRRYSFDDFARYMSSPERYAVAREMACPVQNVVSCGWNNAPRYRDKFTELETPDADQFRRILTALREQACFNDELPLLCNAWNEWSEGAALEPCVYLGNELLRCYTQTENPKPAVVAK